MCGRFTIVSNSQAMTDHFQLVTAEKFTHSYNVTPSSDIPVVRLNDNKRELMNCHWGLIPHWAKDAKIQPINAKAETITEKPFFRSAFIKHRCLIPANGFYEWQGTSKPKQPYYFQLKDSELLAFAGLWEHWEHEGNTIESCTIITTEANIIMNPVHHRMPVILDPDNYDKWLIDGGSDLLNPYSGKMKSYPVSTAVNNPANNSRELIQPLN